LLEASAAAEIQGSNPCIELVAGTFNPDEIYGPSAFAFPSRRESSVARAERKRGIAIPSLPCPTLVIYGEEFRTERGEAIARFYRTEAHFFEGRSHCDLVLDPEVRERISDFLSLGGPARLTSVLEV
jgi:hypothetical protein